MWRYLLLFSVLLATHFSGKGQGDDVTLVIADNNPYYNAYYVGLGIGGGYGENHGLLLPVLAEIGVSTPRISFSADARLQFKFNPKYQNGIQSIYEPEFPRDASALLTTNILNFECKKDIWAHLFQRLSTNYYVKVPAVVNRRWGIDLGIKGGFLWHDLSQIEFTGTDVNGAVYKVGNEVSGADFYNQDRSTFHEYRVLRTGVSFQVLKHLAVLTNQYGTKGSNSNTRYYFHFLTGLYNRLDDVYLEWFYGNYIDELGYVREEPIYLQLDLNETMAFRPYGGAFGICYENIYSFLSTMAKIELSVLPGPKSTLENALFLDFSYAVRFGKFKKRDFKYN